MKQIIFIGILMLLVPALQSQDRKGYILHGHGGNSGKLQTMVSELNRTHKYAAQAFDYQSNDGIAQAGNDARNKMSGSNSLAIGHSMGGITLRQIDKQGGAPFNAAITIGSPHNGAEIARSLESGLGKDVADKAIANIFAGPNRCPVVSFANMILGFGIRQDITTLTQNFLGSKIDEKSNQSSKELQPGAAFFQGSQTTKVPFVSIATYEDRNSLYRLIATEKGLAQGTAVTLFHGLGYVYMGFGVFYTVRGFRHPWTLGTNLARANAWFTGGAQLLYWTERDWNMIYTGVRTSESLGDGFITAASQQFSHANGNIVVDDEGVNHSEQRWHPRVLDEIRGVFVSVRGKYDPVFAVPKR